MFVVAWTPKPYSNDLKAPILPVLAPVVFWNFCDRFRSQ